MNLDQHRLGLRVVIGAAWADHYLDPSEIEYLQTLLQRYRLADDPQLQALLKTPVPLKQTEQWMEEYLRDTTDTERLRLLATIGNLLIADQRVSEVEHDFLDEYHELMARIPAQPEATPTLVQTLGRYVRGVIQSLRG